MGEGVGCLQERDIVNFAFRDLARNAEAREKNNDLEGDREREREGDTPGLIRKFALAIRSNF